MTTKSIAVFLVDDHAILREGLRLLIDAQADMNVVGEADHGRDLPGAIGALPVDVAVIDVSLPGVSGARAAAALKEARPDVKILALTRHHEHGYLQQMIESGASGYILKQKPAAELINAIRTVSRGETYLDPSIVGKLLAPRVPRGMPRQLTERERDVVTLIALGYTNKEIGLRLAVSVKTVEAHKSHVMRKLEITSRAGLVRYALLQGWMESA